MSVFVPFATARIAHAVRAAGRGAASVPSMLGAAGIFAVAMGALGLVLSAAMLAVPWGAEVADFPWPEFPALVAPSLLVQLIPAWVGTGAGLLIENIWVARLLTVVAPVGVNAGLNRLGLFEATEWVTPLGAAIHLFAESMGPIRVLQLAVIFGLWVILPNGLGWRSVASRPPLRPAGQRG